MFSLECLGFFFFCVVIWFAGFLNHQEENKKQAQQGADKCLLSKYTLPNRRGP